MNIDQIAEDDQTGTISYRNEQGELVNVELSEIVLSPEDGGRVVWQSAKRKAQSE